MAQSIKNTIRTRTQILLAGPGTGKTSKIKSIIQKEDNNINALVLSFTNATINDLLSGLQGSIINDQNCMTLHKYAMKINHSCNKHILDSFEKRIIEYYARKLDIDIKRLTSVTNSTTFGQMISQCADFIELNPAYALEKIGKLDLLIVDEYQDFNPDEQKLIDLISRQAQRIIILGDDDQCIYGFKDANSDGIIELYNDDLVNNIEHEHLCYRCPSGVVRACSNLIQKNENRVQKTWKPTDKEDGLSFEQTLNQEKTNTYIIDNISHIKKSDPTASIMILSNIGFPSDPIVSAIKDKQIDYSNWWEVKANESAMTGMWVLRSIFGKFQLLNLLLLSKEAAHTTAERKGVLNIINKYIDEAEYTESDAIENLLKLKHFKSWFINDVITQPQFDSFINKHPEYIQLRKRFPAGLSIEDALEKTTFNKENKIEISEEVVNVMSIHKSKGLQADYVFIVGLVEGIMPQDTRGTDSIEAQRRILFVGMSRARKELHLISQVEWPTRDIFRVDKRKFKIRRKIAKGETSHFVKELLGKE